MALATTGDVSIGGGKSAAAPASAPEPPADANAADSGAVADSPGGVQRKPAATRSGAFSGQGSLDVLVSSFLNCGQVGYVALREDGTIVYASETTELLTGIPPAELLGTNALDLVHPDDAERALLQLSELLMIGTAPGTSTFRVRTPDGSWSTFDILGSMVSDGSDALIGLTIRDAGHQLFLEQLLSRLVVGVAREETLRMVCNSFEWSSLGSAVAIAWCEPEGLRQVGTGVPDSLGGADPGDSSPWAKCCDDGKARQGTADDLDDDRREAARQLGLRAYWVEPVIWQDDSPPATITIWTNDELRAPAIHAYGMGLARNLTEIVLRWTAQTAQLDRAARSDPLTGVANHKSFLSTLQDCASSGAVLFCDLDYFKSVNDTYGHAAGDQLLRVTAQRLQHCVRDTDVVGRLGGDEFAVVIPGANEAEAMTIANRILHSFQQPCHLAEGVDVATIGISIGVACDNAPVSEETLKAADRALGTAKASGRGMVCVAETT
jgi:diguanylate cyclase (GGDEF)-like protein/PAS domain S-box-containing protein